MKILTINAENIDVILAIVLFFASYKYNARKMELRSKTCTLCGQIIGNTAPILEQVVDNRRYSFDTSSCLATFNKFQDVYGKKFVSELAVEN